MKTVKIVFGIFLVLILLVLIFATYKSYREITYTNSYLTFITDSTNGVLADVDDVNMTLNEIQYEENDAYLTLLNDKQQSFRSTFENINQDRQSYKKPYLADDVEASFDEYMTECSSVLDAVGYVVESIESLEEKEDFESKLEYYIVKSDSIKGKSLELEEELVEYSKSYKKIDFDRLLYAVKSI